MKQIFLWIGLMLTTTLALAQSVNIKLQLTSPAKDNRYFICLPNVGCLSVKAANEGKVYRLLHPYKMKAVFLLNLENLKIFAHKLPSSCAISLAGGQTIVIKGHIVEADHHNAAIWQLRCQIR